MLMPSNYVVSIRTPDMICLELRSTNALDEIESILSELTKLNVIERSMNETGYKQEILILNDHHWYQLGSHSDTGYEVKTLERLHAEYIEDSIIENSTVAFPAGYMESISLTQDYWLQMQTYLLTQEPQESERNTIFEQIISNANDMAAQCHAGAISSEKYALAVSCIAIANTMFSTFSTYLSSRIENNPFTVEFLFQYNEETQPIWSLIKPNSKWEEGFFKGLTQNRHFIEMLKFSHDLGKSISKHERVIALTAYSRDNNHDCVIEPLRKMQLL